MGYPLKWVWVIGAGQGDERSSRSAGNQRCEWGQFVVPEEKESDTRRQTNQLVTNQLVTAY